ncbi:MULTISPECIES: heavy metal-binding domain-containing protein [unclassified Leptolyngbya]|uniref:YbjQ family protein n=1 Tax=unclassified Leptolyngbya TaxID=2650499 RepID=UPI0016823B4C|nr:MULTISPECIES: heavy metal-binding domain-containing protein [unclassified Leptolyngbya]MBD1909976.1 heavy metal-binding domain-containing protein [Leptolyngbya sp. FACHB-8]MBD2156824.1 heavy metal-binding domain-containing protein [Leptolyngbya sp. FACHB-16]
MEYFELWFFLALLLIGLFAGSLNEQQHFRNLREREKRVRQLSVINFGAHEPLPDARDAILVTGSVVIASDLFRYYVATLISLIGGQIGVYETLLERGRREAMLRMKEAAIAQGARQVLNFRMETVSINSESSNQGAVVEVIAYGTAIR